jgi:hypothetical protein
MGNSIIKKRQKKAVRKFLTAYNMFKKKLLLSFWLAFLPFSW